MGGAYSEFDGDRPTWDRGTLIQAAKQTAREAADEIGREVDKPGPYDRGNDEWTCPECGETVTRPEWRHAYGDCRCQRDAYEEVYASFLEEYRAGAVEVEWSKAVIPLRFRGATFANFERRAGTEDVLRVCEEYAKTFEPGKTATGLFLNGQFGCGKTHLAIATARACVETCMVRVHFTSTQALLADLKASFDGGGDSKVVERVQKAELLILDDLAQESNSEFDRATLFGIINFRYESLLPTIVTSNCGDKQLVERLGGALVSRLYEMTKPVKFPASVGDYRKKLAKGAV